MKTNPTTFLLLILMFVGCGDDNHIQEDLREKGLLCILCNFDYISINEDYFKCTNNNLKELKVKIINAVSKNEVMVFNTANSLIDSIFLLPGKYYVVVETKLLFSAAFEEPYFYGISPIFEVKPQTYNRAEVLCKISNCAISIDYSENVKTQFVDYYTILSNKDTSLIYAKNETRKAFFKLDPISVRANLTYIDNGEKKLKTLEAKITSPEAGKIYKILIDANLRNTISGISFNIDSTLITQEIVITDSVEANPFWGKILITEIMYDPDSIDDSKGEWFEIYNVSNEVLNLKNLVIRSGTKFHQISKDLYLNPKSYLLFEKTDIATPYEGYIYGSSISFNNTGTVDVTIATFGTNGIDGEVVATVIYGTGTLMPRATGRSLNLSVDCFSIENLSNKDCWCLSDFLYDGKNKGTPGFENKSCN